MSEIQRDSLFILVQSLSTSEIRQFKLYVNRIGFNADAKFLLLFDELKKMKSYDEERIIRKKISSKKQLSNLKAHLYKEILVSLRLKPSHRNNRLQLREQLDFATILYQKGLYRQALKILDKAKNIAFDLDEKTIALNVISLEKVIESQYITRSFDGRADELIRQSQELSVENACVTRLSNLSLRLYHEMLKNGYAQSEKDKATIENIFEEATRGVKMKNLSFQEKLWFFKASVWKHLLLQDYKHAYKYSRHWVELFYAQPEMIENHPVWYIKGNTNLMKTLFLTLQVQKMEQWLTKFLQKVETPTFNYNENLKSLVFVLKYNTLMNIHFIKGDFVGGTQLIPEAEAEIKAFEDQIDAHHFHVLHLKMAALYFGAKNYEACIQYGKKIIDVKQIKVQDDLLFHMRILTLMAMYESGLDEEYDTFAADTQKLIAKMKEATELHHSLLDFFVELSGVSPLLRRQVFNDFYTRLLVYAENPFYKRILLYIDILSWVKAKATGVDVVQIIQSKVNKKGL